MGRENRSEAFTMRLRSRFAIWSAKLTYRAIRWLNRGSGSSFPGAVARRIDPNILSVLSGMVHKKIIAVTGTNGKTTANSILYHALKEEGQKVLYNSMGANLLDGVITAFVLAAGKRGRLDVDYACIETDEIASAGVFAQLKPDCVLVTNIFRDQLDRTGEVEMTCGKIRRALREVPEAVLVLNVDDACSWMLRSGIPNKVIAYGISERLDENIPAGASEMRFCPVCGKRLEYDFIHYGQLGVYHCPGCGLERPRPDISAADITWEGDACCYTLEGLPIRSKTRSPVNVYNTLSAYAALRGAGAPWEKFGETVEKFDYGNRRESRFTINDARVQLYLAKNPVGFQQKLFLLLKDPAPKDVLIQINDTRLDGEDISWLWDVDYHSLASANAVKIVTGGARCGDMGLCLKYSGIPCDFTRDVRHTVEELTAAGSKNLYIITNYSGLYTTNRMLGAMESASKKKGGGRNGFAESHYGVGACGIINKKGMIL